MTNGRDQPGRGEADFAERRPGDEETGRMRRGLGRGIRLFAGEDRLEGRFEPAMRVFQRVDAPGDDIVLLEHLLDRLRLLARELSVDIGHQQFVAEFGHETISG